MIAVLPGDREETERLFRGSGFEPDETSACVVARFGEEVLGFCLFELDEKKIIIRCLEPADDLPLADGILRAALHVAADRSAMDARYAPSAPEEMLLKLGFVTDRKERRLDIDKLFRGCGCKNT